MVIITGKLCGFFHSTRGVKKRDPLSPALSIGTERFFFLFLNKLFEISDFKFYGLHK